MTDVDPATLLRLDGRVALVTGASSGIGAATAVAFGRAGATVMVAGRNPTGVADTMTRLEVGGARGATILGDVAEPDHCRRLVDATVERFGRLDVVANVAGVIGRGDAVATTDDAWRHIMTVNVDAVFHISRAAVAAMRAAGNGGVIINLASNVGLVGATDLAAYCASKGAVVALTRAMALDHAAEGIRINALCPGAVDTPMLVEGHDQIGVTAEEVVAANVAAIPEGRIPSATEIARSMLYLASDASSHVTGVALPVDGGYTAQ